MEHLFQKISISSSDDWEFRAVQSGQQRRTLGDQMGCLEGEAEHVEIVILTRCRSTVPSCALPWAILSGLGALHYLLLGSFKRI